MSEKLCLCGQPAQYGRYCAKCLDSEFAHVEESDIQAAADMFDRLVNHEESATVKNQKITSARNATW